MPCSPARYAVLGLPGTGKTEFGTRLVEEWSKTVDTERIYYLAFTKAASREAASRVGGNPDEYPNFKTIHAICFRAMMEERRDVKVIRPSHWKAFAKETSMNGNYSDSSEDLEDVAGYYQSIESGGRTTWDVCHDQYSLSRLVSGSLEELDAIKIQPHRNALKRISQWISMRDYQAFVEKYEGFKEREGLIDFSDMLEHVYRSGRTLGCDYVVVDESQDLTPIHFRLIDRLFADAKEIWLIGDDDQLIFAWAGALVEEYLDQLNRSKKIVLQQTHRFGQEIVDFAVRIIRRVKRRIPKDVLGVPGRRGEVSESWNFKPEANEERLILHRHVAGCRELTKLFVKEGIPVQSERGHSPLSAKNHISAFRAIDDLSKGFRVFAGRLSVLFDDVMPTFWMDQDDAKVRLLGNGARRKIKELGPVHMSIPELIDGKLLTPEGAKAIREKDWRVFKHNENLMYYQRILNNGYDLDAQWPKITTIHGSKGRQAPHVTIFPEMTRKCWQDLDGEHRVAYVAGTRAEHSVTICHVPLLEWASAPYGYPVEVEVEPEKEPV